MSDLRASASPIAMQPSPADDLLDGADAIGRWLGWSRRRVYHAAEKRQLPVIRVGGRLMARRSTLAAWLAELERQSVDG